MTATTSRPGYTDAELADLQEMPVDMLRHVLTGLEHGYSTAGMTPADVTAMTAAVRDELEERGVVEPCCLGWGKGWHEYDCPDHA